MKKSYGTFFLSWILLAALLTGCMGEPAARSPESGSDTPSESSSAQSAPEPADSDSESEEAGKEDEEPRLAFECHDMDGNDVSEAVFANSKLTMVNVWATFCGPCLNEMPALGELAAEYDPADFQVIGVISDVADGGDADALSYAAALIVDTGADYVHLPVNRSLYYALVEDISVVPTTLFVDENGVVLETVIGAQKKKEWVKKIDALLEGL